MAKLKTNRSHKDTLTSERSVYTAFSQLQVAIFVIAALDYNIEFANDYFLKLLQKRKSILGKSLFTTFPELAIQDTKEIIDRVLRTGEAVHMVEHEVFLLKNRKKEQRFFNSNFQAVEKADGSISGVIVIFTEVTRAVNSQKTSNANERNLKAALGAANIRLASVHDEKRKLENEKRIENYPRSLIEASRDPLFAINTDGKVTDINNASVLITGSSRESLIGSNFLDHFTDAGKASDAYQEIFAKGYVVDFPLTIRDHKLTEVLFNGSVYNDENHNPVGVVAVARDVTDQKLIEHDLEKSLREISDYKYALDESSIVSITDKKGVIRYANDNFCRISQYTFNELIGRDHRMMNSGYHSRQFIANLWRMITDGKIWKGEFCNKAKDGTIYWVDTTIVPFIDKNREPYQYIVIRTDITRQKIIEQELTHAKKVAEEAMLAAREEQNKAEEATETAKNAMRSKQQFLSNMSHEIRTPMNAIIGFTKVLLKTELTQKQIEYLSAIKTSGDALIVLINDILDLAKVDSGKMTFEKIRFKLSSSIAAMLHLFESKIQEKNLLLIREYDSAIPDFLIGDPVRLHQIIINLVSNAVKFTDQGEIHLIVRLIEETEAGVKIEFQVTDTGIGVSALKLETIFENFQQATSATSRVYGGTGLGLAIVKQLVETQGGRISVTSEPGKGSDFRFALNFDKAVTNEEFTDDAMDLDPDVKDISVLIVEDIALNQLLMKTLLDDYGFQSEIAANGKIAIEKLTKKPFDIILMDLQMPEMDGFEATRHIRQNLNSQVPIMALTADVTTADVAKCKAVGMNDYISKPVDERMLYTKIVGLIKQSIARKDDQLLPSSVSENRYTNLAYLKRRTKSNTGLMTQMISIYIEQTPLLIKIIKQSYLEQDWSGLYSAAHKLVPSFSIMGLRSEYETIARNIQDFAADPKPEKHVSELIDSLESACLQACRELEAELHNIQNLKA